VIALDLGTGNVKWAQKLWGYDAWNSGCNSKNSNCPPDPGPDFDFSQQPIFLPNPDIVIAGQKTGILWAFHPENGNILWSTTIGPSGKTGGMQFGSAADLDAIYVASANSEFKNHTLMTNVTITGGSWAAVNQRTGKILWQTPNPTNQSARASVTIANGVMFASSWDRAGHYYALNAQNGEILFDFPCGEIPKNGPAVVDGYVYWGCGLNSTWSSTKFYAFGLD